MRPLGMSDAVLVFVLQARKAPLLPFHCVFFVENGNFGGGGEREDHEDLCVTSRECVFRVVT